MFKYKTKNKMTIAKNGTNIFVHLFGRWIVIRYRTPMMELKLRTNVFDRIT